MTPLGVHILTSTPPRKIPLHKHDLLAYGAVGFVVLASYVVWQLIQRGVI